MSIASAMVPSHEDSNRLFWVYSAVAWLFLLLLVIFDWHVTRPYPEIVGFTRSGDPLIGEGFPDVSYAELIAVHAFGLAAFLAALWRARIPFNVPRERWTLIGLQIALGSVLVVCSLWFVETVRATASFVDFMSRLHRH
jgi:hypothetical protein